MAKRFLVWLLAISMLLGMAGFAAAEEQQTIRVLWWGSQTRHDSSMLMVEKFMEKYPDIKVEAEFTDWNGYWSKLATQAAGGLVPDVIQMDYMYLVQYAQNGVLADLKPYMDSSALDVTNVAESVLLSAQVGEGIYALATGTNAMILAYRQDVLDEAGLTMPMEPTDAEYLEIAKAVYEATGRTDTFSTACGIELLRFNLRSMGLQLYNEEGTALGFDDPSFLVHLWERSLTARREGYGLGVGEETATTSFDGFVQDTWTGAPWSNQLAAYEEGSGCELTMCVIPSLEGAIQAPTYFKPTMFWSVAETSENKDAAIAFLNFFLNDTDCYDIVGMDRGMPVSSAIREYIAPSLDEPSQKVAAMLDYLGEDGRTTPIMKPDVAAHGEINALLDSYNEQVRYELVDDLTAFAQEWMDEANALIAKSLEE